MLARPCRNARAQRSSLRNKNPPTTRVPRRLCNSRLPNLLRTQTRSSVASSSSRLRVPRRTSERDSLSLSGRGRLRYKNRAAPRSKKSSKWTHRRPSQSINRKKMFKLTSSASTPPLPSRSLLKLKYLRLSAKATLLQPKGLRRI